jgi:uncharacterized repeat protein (TIGR01451 family)
MYHWDVLQGSYRLHVEAPGYEPANSIVLSIPPPVTDLAIGLHYINGPVLPIANFSSNVTGGYAPLDVQFTDLSTNTTNLQWNFGDGSNNTSVAYPEHVFTSTGLFNVVLTASNIFGSNSKSATINITKLTPLIYWNNPPDIVFGTALNSNQLNASASVNGTFVYTPAAGTILGVGRKTLHASFTPTDITNYTNASKDVTINVTSATPLIYWDNPPDIVFGTALNSNQLNASASVNGTFVYTPAAGTVLGVGLHTLRVDFIPTDTANYTNASKNVTINVLNASYSIFKSVIDPDPTGDCIINKAGDIVPYRIVVKNEGKVDLTNVTVNDTLISPLPEPTGDNIDPGVLNMGETWTYDAIYTLTPEDAENGSINNNATVTCDQLPGKTVSVNTPVDQNAELSIYKSVTGIDESGDRIINEVGDVINYQVVVKNNGNIDLTDVLVSDPMVDLTKRSGDSADSGVLNPGETWVYTGDYTVTQEDIDRAMGGNATIENTASVSCNQLSEENSSLELSIIYNPPNVLTPESTPEPENSTVLPVVNSSTNASSGNSVGSGDNSVGSGENSGGGNSEGKAVVVTNDANGSPANTAAPANVSPTETNNGQSSTPANVEPTPVQTTTGTPAKESKKTPGFELFCGITGLLAVYLYRRK